ncbi:hypothetical protein [Stutzerimonas stutzeri]|uniref:hypothetical protein n=1 Tax=Stutzerimonas stutzeri TaxID=316 RepID=UPI0021099EDA|nr:hypothetical protein [Stutzerimonas stutzeri]MCQ4261100.1 hypothetical protein [Stutzerimonas stutzeri]
MMLTETKGLGTDQRFSARHVTPLYFYWFSGEACLWLAAVTASLKFMLALISCDVNYTATSDE